MGISISVGYHFTKPFQFSSVSHNFPFELVFMLLLLSVRTVMNVIQLFLSNLTINLSFCLKI